MSLPPPHSLQQRRNSRRVRCSLATQAQCDTGLAFACTVVELSPSGLRIRSERPFKSLREHALTQVIVDNIGQLAVEMRWHTDHEAGLALVGDFLEQELLKVYLSQLEGEARAAAARHARQGPP